MLMSLLQKVGRAVSKVAQSRRVISQYKRNLPIYMAFSQAHGRYARHRLERNSAPRRVLASRERMRSISPQPEPSDLPEAPATSQAPLAPDAESREAGSPADAVEPRSVDSKGKKKAQEPMTPDSENDMTLADETVTREEMEGEKQRKEIPREEREKKAEVTARVKEWRIEMEESEREEEGNAGRDEELRDMAARLQEAQDEVRRVNSLLLHVRMQNCDLEKRLLEATQATAAQAYAAQGLQGFVDGLQHEPFDDYMQAAPIPWPQEVFSDQQWQSQQPQEVRMGDNSETWGQGSVIFLDEPLAWQGLAATVALTTATSSQQPQIFGPESTGSQDLMPMVGTSHPDPWLLEFQQLGQQPPALTNPFDQLEGLDTTDTGLVFRTDQGQSSAGQPLWPETFHEMLENDLRARGVMKEEE